MSLNTEKIRKDFPILKREINGNALVYFDNASTSQKPQSVIDSISSFYTNSNANVHRGTSTLSEEASELYEGAHRKVADFIGADSIAEIAFTNNTTESLNLIAYSWGLNNLRKNDEVVITRMEHHSNLIPWQQICNKTGAQLKFIELNEDYTLNLEKAEEIMSSRTKLVSAVHVSNSLGTINDVKTLGKIAHDNNALMVVDGAQSAPHMEIDVKDIDCDFFAFSGHKMLGPTGIGALYGQEERMKELEPFNFGGGMISEVEYDSAKWNVSPWKFEAGTPNIAQGIGFGEAVDYLSNVGMNKIYKHEKELTKYALEELENFEDLRMYIPPLEKLAGIISFTMEGIHPHDISALVDEEGVAIRGGHHCTQPLMKLLGIDATARASFYLYNTKEEIDIFVEALKKARDLFK
ncbi:TPA: cysteine desulfurase [archaeon]|jgi:cysteine desulfurase/selenocysteine lyase|uniref:Cysteine desulfurase n=1 Tax=Candidatus Undinarchaeum marinum TaxID=2756141 RepID=A0A832V268_9ARCH|nr:cysteine desulfurase [Candidatus Undinarchaeum marinum]